MSSRTRYDGTNTFFYQRSKESQRERNFCNYVNLDTIADPISKAINRFELHPSILKIQETIKIKELFVFAHITPRDVVRFFI